MKIKKLLNPAIIYSSLILTQFIIWLVFFDLWKSEIPGINEIPKYISSRAAIKYILHIATLLAWFYLGKYLSSSKTSINSYKNKNYSMNIRFITNILSNINIMILIIIHCYILLLIINNNLISLISSSGLQVLSYSTTHNKENYWRIFLNLLIIEGFIESDLYFYSHKKKAKYKLLLIITFSIFDGILLAERMLLIVVIIVSTTIYLKHKVKFSYNIKASRIFACFLILLFILIISEIFRFGVINAIEKKIKLLSLNNITDVIKYLTVAYFGKNVNNAMIIFDSRPTYNFFGTGSQLVMTILNYFKKPNEFTPIINMGPYGTVDMAALIWQDFGVISILIMSILGFMIGFIYEKYVKNDNVLYNFAYSLVIAGTISSIRMNFFLSNFFIIPFIYIIIIKLLYIILYE